MNNEPLIRIMIVDDHAVVRSGLGAFLLAFDDLDLVAEAGSGEEAVAHCRRQQLDVVLMDLMMPGMDGAQATEAIREHCPTITGDRPHQLQGRGVDPAGAARRRDQLLAEERLRR